MCYVYCCNTNGLCEGIRRKQRWITFVHKTMLGKLPWYLRHLLSLAGSEFDSYSKSPEWTQNLVDPILHSNKQMRDSLQLQHLTPGTNKTLPTSCLTEICKCYSWTALNDCINTSTFSVLEIKCFKLYQSFRALVPKTEFISRDFLKIN